MSDWCPTMPPWVRRIRVGRGEDLNVMGRTILEGLWFCAPVSRAGEMFSGPVDLGRWTPTIQELAAANGVSEVSAGKAIRSIISVGWATRNGRSLVLAWRFPGEFGGLCTRSSKIADTAPEDRSILEDRILEDRAEDPRVRSTGSSGKVKSIPEDRSHLTTPLPHTTQLPRVEDPEQFALISPSDVTPKRDAVAEVIAHYNTRKAAAAAWAGLGSPTPIKAKDHRKAIASRIGDGDDTDDGVARLKRVIDVQEAQARAHGKTSGPEDRKRLKRQSGWKYWRPTTLFTEKNVVRWLDRWDQDGDHEIWSAGKDDDPLPTPERVRQPIKRIEAIRIDTRGFAPTARDIER